MSKQTDTSEARVHFCFECNRYWECCYPSCSTSGTSSRSLCPSCQGVDDIVFKYLDNPYNEVKYTNSDGYF